MEQGQVAQKQNQVIKQRLLNQFQIRFLKEKREKRVLEKSELHKNIGIN